MYITCAKYNKYNKCACAIWRVPEKINNNKRKNNSKGRKNNQSLCDSEMYDWVLNQWWKEVLQAVVVMLGCLIADGMVWESPTSASRHMVGWVCGWTCSRVTSARHRYDKSVSIIACSFLLILFPVFASTLSCFTSTTHLAFLTSLSSLMAPTLQMTPPQHTAAENMTLATAEW